MTTALIPPAHPQTAPPTLTSWILLIAYTVTVLIVLSTLGPRIAVWCQWRWELHRSRDEEIPR